MRILMALPLTALFLSALLIALARADNAAVPQYTAKTACGDAFLWSPDGSRVPGTGTWGTPYFRQGPCLGIAGIGTTETFQKTVIIIDRTDFLNSYMAMPDTGGQVAWSEEVNLNTRAWTQRPLNILTNSFCSSGQHGPNGTFFNIGGDQAQGLSNYIGGQGGMSMRALTPCKDATCTFAIAGNMKKNRWYPTSQLLADGRIVVVGGASTGVALNAAATDVPSLEYYPKKTPGEGVHPMPFLTDALPYNLYPFVHLLPNGNLFVFAGDSYVLWDTVKNAVAPGKTPPIGANTAAGVPITHSYPLAGTSAMFTLSPKTGYQPEIMICGGSATSGFPSLGMGNGDAPADNGCWRISPLAAKPQWTEERMKVPRVQLVAVLLPDGHVLIHGGTRTGYEGIPNAAHNATLIPELYNSKTHTWFAGPTGVSRVPRAYHSSAILLHDGTVFVSGSNPHQDGIQVMGDDFPTEFRTEFYLPPYFQLRVPPPAVIRAPVNVKVGTNFWVAFRAQPGAKTISIVLSQPGFSTHASNHGMRQVELAVKQLRTNGNVYAALVAAPPSLNVCPPTYYWMFIVVNGKPNRDGHYVMVN